MFSPKMNCSHLMTVTQCKYLAVLQSFLRMAGYLGRSTKDYATTAASLFLLTRRLSKFHWGNREDLAFRKIQDSISSKKTMAFFNPSKPIIILHSEASFNKG